MANYFLNEKASLFEYFWKGFNVSLISVGDRFSIFEKAEDGLLYRVTEKLFDYLSFYDSFSYLVGISAFCLYKPPKQPEKFVDLLNRLAEDEEEKTGSSAAKDIINLEAKTKEHAKELIQEAYKEADALGYRGNIFIRFMVYNVKSQTVSNLHLVDTVCHPCFPISSVPLFSLLETLTVSPSIEIQDTHRGNTGRLRSRMLCATQRNYKRAT